MNLILTKIECKSYVFFVFFPKHEVVNIFQRHQHSNLLFIHRQLMINLASNKFAFKTLVTFKSIFQSRVDSVPDQ